MSALRSVGPIVAVLVGCASDARPPAAGDGVALPREAVTPQPSTAASLSASPSAVTSASADPAASPSAAPTVSAADAQPATSAATPPRLAVPGATECTDAETSRSWCARAGRSGECIDGTCLTVALCPAYCTAVAAREHDCLMDVDAECAKVPACVRDTKTVQDMCRALRRNTAADCRRYVCGRLALMPRPPVPDSRD